MKSWDSVRALEPDSDSMAVEYQKVLQNYMSRCYEWKRARRKSNDKPWVSDGIREQMKRKKKIFKTYGRNDAWKRLDAGIKKSLAIRKKNYNKVMKDKLEKSGNTGKWWSISRYLESDETPKRWDVTDLKPDQDPRLLAKDLATHFASVTNEATALKREEIPHPLVGDGHPRFVSVAQVAKRLKKMKKPNSRVRGDIPKKHRECYG